MARIHTDQEFNKISLDTFDLLRPIGTLISRCDRSLLPKTAIGLRKLADKIYFIAVALLFQ